MERSRKLYKELILETLINKKKVSKVELNQIVKEELPKRFSISFNRPTFHRALEDLKKEGKIKEDGDYIERVIFIDSPDLYKLSDFELLDFLRSIDIRDRIVVNEELARRIYSSIPELALLLMLHASNREQLLPIFLNEVREVIVEEIVDYIIRGNLLINTLISNHGEIKLEKYETPPTDQRVKAERQMTLYRLMDINIPHNAFVLSPFIVRQILDKLNYTETLRKYKDYIVEECINLSFLTPLFTSPTDFADRCGLDPLSLSINRFTLVQDEDTLKTVVCKKIVYEGDIDKYAEIWSICNYCREHLKRKYANNSTFIDYVERHSPCAIETSHSLD